MTNKKIYSFLNCSSIFNRVAAFAKGYRPVSEKTLPFKSWRIISIQSVTRKI
jgi:hypothetical protein